MVASSTKTKYYPKLLFTGSDIVKNNSNIKKSYKH